MTFTSYFGFTFELDTNGAEAAAAHAAALGYDSVELLNSYTSDTPLPKRHPASEVRRALDAHGLTVACYSLYAHLLLPDEDSLYREYAEHIDYAVAIGSPFMHYTLRPGPRTADDPSFDEMLALILPRAATIAEMAKEKGIVCLFEPQGFYFNGVEGLSAFYRAISERCPDVGICGDMGNSLFADCDPADIFRTFGNKIRHVHIKDYVISDSPLPGASLSAAGRYLKDAVPGDGSIDFEPCFRVLREVGYDGAIALEFASSDEEVKRTMDYVRRMMNT